MTLHCGHVNRWSVTLPQWWRPEDLARLNSQEKWDAIRAKIVESACNIVCLQETKREDFNVAYLKKFCPRHLDSFAFSPSTGASGGLVTIWKSNLYQGDTIQINSYAITVKMTSLVDQSCFHLTNIYGPAHSSGKLAFITWILNLDSSSFDDWLLTCDFNLYRGPDNRNKPGGDHSEMQLLNNTIIDLDLINIPFSGRRFTWSNMQLDPLLVKLDWVFVSSAWGLSFPATTVQPMSKPLSDHIPYVINIGSKVPKGYGFRFENFWVDQPEFMSTVGTALDFFPFFANATRTLSAKFKQTRAGLRNWSKSLSNLSRLIHNCNWVLLLLDGLEDQRPLKIKGPSAPWNLFLELW